MFLYAYRVTVSLLTVPHIYEFIDNFISRLQLFVVSYKKHDDFFKYSYKESEGRDILKIQTGQSFTLKLTINHTFYIQHIL